MQSLEGIEGLVVRQQKEWGEILTGFETRNRYLVQDTHGNNLFYAAEEGGSVLLRLFLKAMRPFQINVYSLDQLPVLSAARPFRFYFHEIIVTAADGTELGRVKRNFSFFRRIYTVFGADGQEAFQLFGPILHPWTFKIRGGSTEYGKITKKWSGLLKEGFTDADNFGVVFPSAWPAALKGLFLGAVFLIDFVHFENRNR